MTLRFQIVRALTNLQRVGEESCVLAVAAMAGLVLLQVVLRYVFRSPLVWTEEASVLLMIWMTFVGAGVAVRRGSHIAMTLLIQRFPRALMWAVFVLSWFIVLVFLVVVAWQGWLLAMSVGGQRSPALAIPMTWPYLIMPVGALFMATQVVAVLLGSAETRT